MSYFTQRFILATVFLAASTAGVAHEPPSGLLIHMPFDGSAEVRGRAMAAEVVSTDPDNPVGSLSYVSGYQGQAALFDGESAVRIPFDLNPDRYPQLTVTMWINAQKDQQTGYLFSNGSPAGPKLQYSMANLIAHAPGALARVPNMVRIGRWVFVAAVWDHAAGKMRMHVDRRVEEVDLEGVAGRRDPRAKPESWIGTYNANLQSTVKGVLIDEVRIYGRALSAEELLGLALGPPIEEKPRQTGPFVIPEDGEGQLIEPPEEEEGQLIEPPLPPEDEEPQLIEPPLPPEEESEPHEAPFDVTGSRPDPRDEMHRDRSASADDVNRPGEDPKLDKLRRTQAPGGHQSDDAVRDVLSDSYEPGPTTDWEQVQEEARKPKVDDEQLGRMRETVGSEVAPGTERINETVRDQLGENEVPESTDFETRRQALESEEDSVSAGGGPGVGTLEVTPAEDGELYVRVKPGAAVETRWLRDPYPKTHSITLDLEDHAIHTIEWFEQADNPCKVVVYGYAPGTNQFGGANVTSFGRDVCKSSANDRSRKRATIVGDGAAITKLSIWVVKTIGRRYYPLKGVEIWGLRIQGNGTLSNDGAYDKANRPNVKAPTLGTGGGRVVSCPDGHVATGIKFQYQENRNTSPLIYNMALICREVDD